MKKLVLLIFSFAILISESVIAYPQSSGIGTHSSRAIQNSEIDELYSSELFHAFICKGTCKNKEKAAADERINQITQEMQERGYSQDKIRLISNEAKTKALQFLLQVLN